MGYIQTEIFTVVELSWMRDPRRRRNYSAAREEFAREHAVRRAFGKALHQAARLRRADAEARAPEGGVRWIEAARAAFREAHKKRAEVAAARERDRRRAAGELFDWASFTNRWRKKYATGGPQRNPARTAAVQHPGNVHGGIVRRAGTGRSHAEYFPFEAAGGGVRVTRCGIVR